MKQQYGEKTVFIDNLIDQLAKPLPGKLADTMTERLILASNESEELENQIKLTENELDHLQYESEISRGHIQDINALFRKLFTDDEKEDDIRLELRLKIRQIVDKIVLWPVGLQGRMLYQMGGKGAPQIIPVEDFYAKYISYFKSEIQKYKDSTDAGERLYAKQCRNDLRGCFKDISAYHEETTGRLARVAHIYFKTGDFREICFDPEIGYYVFTRYSEKEQAQMIEQEAQRAARLDKVKEKGGDVWEHILDELHGLDDERPLMAPERVKIPVYKPESEYDRKQETIKRIFHLKDVKNLGYRGIADILNKEGVITLTGKSLWKPANLSRVYCAYKGKK